MVTGSSFPDRSLESTVHQDFIANAEGLATKTVNLKEMTIDVENASVNAYELRAGLMLAILDADGSYMEYDDTKSDGREDARAVLMNDVIYQVSVATLALVGWGCTFSEAGLHGLDDAAIVDMLPRGSKFNLTP
jgi:hypothetical protein